MGKAIRLPLSSLHLPGFLIRSIAVFGGFKKTHQATADCSLGTTMNFPLKDLPRPKIWAIIVP